jgi:cell division septation protein DedD
MAKAANSGKNRSATPPASRRPAGKSRRWGVLLLVSVWMFVLGVLVGRGTAPVHFDTEALQEELASLREAVVKKERNRFRIFENDAGPEKAENLDFYENLKKSAPEKPPAPAADVPANRPETDKTGKKTLKPPKPATKAVSAREKPYTIQVASLREEKMAVAMVDRLQANGYPAYRERAEIEGKGIWHRVRIGSFAGPADAARTLQRLKSADLKPLLIRK